MPLRCSKIRTTALERIGESSAWEAQALPIAADVNVRSGETRSDFATPAVLLDLAIQLEELVAEAEAHMIPRAEINASSCVPNAALVFANARGEPVRA